MRIRGWGRDLNRVQNERIALVERMELSLSTGTDLETYLRSLSTGTDVETCLRMRINVVDASRKNTGEHLVVVASMDEAKLLVRRLRGFTELDHPREVW